MRSALRGLRGRGRPPPLTARQAEVVGLVARGYRTREIASALGVSERAITAHITRLMAKFRVPNRSGLIAAVMAAAGFGMPPTQRPPLTRVGAQAHLATLPEDEHQLYAHAPFLVAVTRGPDHIFTFVNRMWERVMGHRSLEVIGKRVLDVFPDAPPGSYAARERAYREGRPTTGKAWRSTWKQNDGTPREADLGYIYQPLRSSAGEIEGVLLIATEVDDAASSRRRSRPARDRP